MPIRKKKPQTLPAILPNAGIERQYRRVLIGIVQEMQADIQSALIKEFRKRAQQEKLAMDGISDWIGHVIDYLIDRWNQQLETLSPEIAALFVQRTVINYDAQLKKHLRDAGFTVRLRMTPFQQEALQASMAENVGLIKSIGSEYLNRVQTHVWQSVPSGFDLATLSKNLQNDFGVTKRRADFIARDQAYKANAVIESARRRELGIKKAIWLHSHAGKQPRPSHVKASGKEFDVSKGMYLDGEWVLPGQLINCRCGSKSIIEGIVE